MPARFVFFRLLSSDQAEWLQPDGRVQHGPLTALAEQALGARPILIAPGEAVMLHPISAPSRKRSTWARAVPYALEDQLAEDIEALHFALGSALDEGRLPVAVIGHDLLRAWLHRCEQSGLLPTAAVPEPLLLPWREGFWSVLLEDRRAVVRTGRWQGFATERETLALWLTEALIEAGETKPQGLRLWGEPLAELAEAPFAELQNQIESSVADTLPLYATTYQPSASLNLLQGPYSRQASWGRWLRPWRATAALVGALLLLQGGVSLYNHWRLQQEMVWLSSAMEQLYKEAVPGATRIVNPKAQLEARLRELRPGNAGGSTFFDLLQRGGQPLAHFPDILLRGLNYRDGQLDLSLQGGAPADLDQLRQQFNQQPGLQVEMRTTQRDGQAESKVTLKKSAL